MRMSSSRDTSDDDHPGSSKTDSKIVMAEQSVHDVVDQARSVGESSPADVSETNTTSSVAFAAANNQNTELSTAVDPSFLSFKALSDHVFADNQVKEDTSIEDIDKGVVTGGKVFEVLDDSLGIVQIDGREVSDALPISTIYESAGNNEVSSLPNGVDGSIHSDTDSKPDTSDVVAQDSVETSNHVRSSSMKKPATFKAVSVTRNFLAKAGASSTPVIKSAADKANSSTTNTAGTPVQAATRPRLVAKSVSGHRAITPRSISIGSKNGKESGPDPMQVWNKNRVAAPQATPKHLTDEELKQQYGIHLASRLQEEGDGKEAKWADIDDDEDDWAPETIEWNDGTKITLTSNETPTILPEEEAVPMVQKQSVEEPMKQPSSLGRITTTVGPNATVLKVGSIQPKTNGLVMKGSSDKPTLVARPSQPAAVKSPWAPLPPVERVPPISATATTQSPSSRFSQRDPHGFESMPPPPSPAKEIAADDFSRSWRDPQNAVPKELFNSQSGRYEPVAENRRGSMRKEQNFRPPSLLQRPSHDPHAPAEPSLAFQTRQSNQQDSNWQRRRDSSTFSGDSSNQGRRTSISQDHGHDAPNDSPLGPAYNAVKTNPRDSSPLQARAKSITSQSPTMISPQQVSAPDGTSTVTTPSEDPIAAQQRLMREKREAAIRRKKEEEAREKAEREERIKLRMEKMGLAPKEEKKAVIAQSPTFVSQQREKNSAPHSPPKPPVPDVTGPPKQYGMMKVHGPPAMTTGHMSPEKGAQSQPVVQSEQDNKNCDVSIDGEISHNRPDPTSAPSPQHQPHQFRDHKMQSWQDTRQLPNGQSTWNNTGMTTHSSAGANLWGPPGNQNRSLGNGDFKSNVQRPDPRQTTFYQHLSSPTPQPIGTPKSMQRSPAGQGLAKAIDPASRSAFEDSQTIPAYPSPEPLPAATQPVELVTSSQNTEVLRETPRLGPLAWANFHAVSAREEAEAHEQAMTERVEKLAEEERTGVIADLRLPAVNETWRQVQVNSTVGQRSVVAALKATSNPSESTQEGTSAPSAKTLVAIGPSSGTVRASRFFPPSQGLQSHGQRAVSFPLTSTRPLSPPPPDSVDHPAHLGGHLRPLVNLPPINKPKPTVKLPPSVPNPQEILEPTITQTASLRAVSQPFVTRPAWQDRFNSLLGRKPSPEKKFAQVASTSKTAFEVSAINEPAAISFPRDDSRSKSSVPEEPATKPVEEVDALFEERKFGSVPTVNIPTTAPVHAWQPARIPKGQRSRDRPLTQHEVSSAVAFNLDDKENYNFQAKGLVLFVKLPGPSNRTSKVLQHMHGPNVVKQMHPPQLHSPKARPGKNNFKPQSNAGSRKPSQNQPVKPSIRSNTNQPMKSKASSTPSWANRPVGAVQ